MALAELLEKKVKREAMVPLVARAEEAIQAIVGRKVNVEQTLLPQDQRVRKEWLDCRGSLVGKERRETKDLEALLEMFKARKATRVCPVYHLRIKDHEEKKEFRGKGAIQASLGIRGCPVKKAQRVT